MEIVLAMESGTRRRVSGQGSRNGLCLHRVPFDRRELYTVSHTQTGLALVSEVRLSAAVEAMETLSGMADWGRIESKEEASEYPGLGESVKKLQAQLRARSSASE